MRPESPFAVQNACLRHPLDCPGTPAALPQLPGLSTERHTVWASTYCIGSLIPAQKSLQLCPHHGI